MEYREWTVLTLIYPRLPGAKRVLLGLKKRGFGAGKLNGFGGKLEEGETVEESAARELREESGLCARPEDFRWCGTLTYLYDTKPKAMAVHVYDVEAWEGEPTETEEMRPSWFCHDEVPLEQMWADDAYWLRQYLDGQLAVPFTGRFRFKGHEGVDSWVVLEHHVASIPAPRTPSSLPGSALLASTVCFLNAPGRSASPLESFIRYHLLKGFQHVLLFIDSPEDTAALAAARKFPRASVTTRVRGQALLQEQRRVCKAFEEFEPLMRSEVSARQLLDAELAMAMAPDFGCSWVVYLDADELFFTKQDSIVPHFQALESAGIDQMTYLNHEGVPERLEVDDYFSATTLFRQHQFAVPLTASARQGLRFWMDRSRRGQYFLLYDNGKSACRVGLGARPRNQHVWTLPEGRRTCTALADPRRMDIEGYRACEDPCILHFPVCGLSWLRAKYRTLGAFPDAWLGRVPLPASFHRDAREASARDVAEGAERAERGSSMEALFRSEVLLDDPAEVRRQLAAGTCLRIEAHARALEATPCGPQAALSSTSTPTTKPEHGALRQEGEALGDERLSAATVTSPAPMDAGPQGIERGWIISKAMGYL